MSLQQRFYFCVVFQLEDFVKSDDNFGTAARAVTQTVERVKANIEWRKNNEKHIEEWLEAVVKELNIK